MSNDNHPIKRFHGQENTEQTRGRKIIEQTRGRENPERSHGWENIAPSFSALALHAGYDPAEHHHSSGVPLYQTAAYALPSEEYASRIVFSELDDDIYSRISNPTTGILEKRLAALHGVSGAVATSSGLAALGDAILNIAAGGGRILTSYRLYGGTVAAFSNVLPDYGISFDFAHNPDDPRSWEERIRPDTKALLVESVSNPLNAVADLGTLAGIAHTHGIALIVDNTLATPYLLNPFDFGADIVVYSTTKSINGHGNAIGGIVLESGAFDYASGRYPQFSRKAWTLRTRDGRERSILDVAPNTPFTARLRSFIVTLLGSSPSPFNSYLTLLGLETLSARLDKETRTARKVAEFLDGDPRVAKVFHPAAHDYAYRDLASKYLKHDGSTLITFDLDTEERKRDVLDALRLFQLQANIGDSKSLAVDPLLVTHSELTPDELYAAGIHHEAIRLSIGLEEPDDLIADLAQALDHAYGIANN